MLHHVLTPILSLCSQCRQTTNVSAPNRAEFTFKHCNVHFLHFSNRFDSQLLNPCPVATPATRFTDSGRRNHSTSSGRDHKQPIWLHQSEPSFTKTLTISCCHHQYRTGFWTVV